MRKRFTNILHHKANHILILVAFFFARQVQAQLFPNLGGQRAGISAITFLKNDISPRSTAMGGANVATDGDGYSILNNPAGAVDNKYLNTTLSNMFYAAGLNQTYLGVTYPTENKGAILGSLNYLTPGAMEVRTEFQPMGTGQMFQANAYNLGLGYAKSLSSMFSFGVFAKYIRETLAEYRSGSVAVDLGFLYRTDWKDLKFAVAVQHFGGNTITKGSQLPVTFNRQNGVQLDNYPMPTLFKMGVSMVPWKVEGQSLMITAQLNHPADNAENIRLGAEYNFEKLLFLRAGYKINVFGEKLPTAGVGLRHRVGRHPFMIDYGVNPTQFLGIYHTVGFSFLFNNQDRE
jgi:hypothetical protein